MSAPDKRSEWCKIRTWPQVNAESHWLLLTQVRVEEEAEKRLHVSPDWSGDMHLFMIAIDSACLELGGASLTASKIAIFGAWELGASEMWAAVNVTSRAAKWSRLGDWCKSASHDRDAVALSRHALHIR